jgi:hypothetical protein
MVESSVAHFPFLVFFGVFFPLSSFLFFLSVATGRTGRSRNLSPQKYIMQTTLSKSAFSRVIRIHNEVLDGSYLKVGGTHRPAQQFFYFHRHRHNDEQAGRQAGKFYWEKDEVCFLGDIKKNARSKVSCMPQNFCLKAGNPEMGGQGLLSLSLSASGRLIQNTSTTPTPSPCQHAVNGSPLLSSMPSRRPAFPQFLSNSCTTLSPL